MSVSAQSSRVRHFDLSLPVLGALGLLLCALVLLPLGWLAYYAFTDKAGHFTTGNFVTIFSNPAFLEPFLRTSAISVAVALASVAVATPLAWLVARTDMPFRRWIRVLVTASFVTPPFLGAIAWEILAAPNAGLLNQLYQHLFGRGTYDNLFNIYTETGLVFVMACYAFPYVFVLLANAIERIPGDLEDASSILGGGRWVTLRRVVLPMTLPSLLAGALIAFLQAMTQFGAPAVLALPAGFHVITTKIWSLFQSPPQPQLAAAAALPLLLVTVLLLQAQRWLLGRRGYTVTGGKSGMARPIALGHWRWAAFAFALAVMALTMLLPYAALIKASFLRTASDPLTFEKFTLYNYQWIYSFPESRRAFFNTFSIGLMSATCGAALALVVASLAARRGFPGARVLAALATSPVAIPGIVLGVGLFLSYTRPPLVLYGTPWILLLAFVTIELPAAYQQLEAALLGLHPELEEASRIFGANRLKVLLQITAPLIATSVVATWCFIFIGAIRELSATIMLTTANTKLVSILIYDLNESGDLGLISVLGLVLLVITFAVVGLANRVPGLRQGSVRSVHY
ncbi:MAG: iron ABC transporter permease [Stellaceae bacterium]